MLHEKFNSLFRLRLAAILAQAARACRIKPNRNSSLDLWASITRSVLNERTQHIQIACVVTRLILRRFEQESGVGQALVTRDALWCIMFAVAEFNSPLELRQLRVPILMTNNLFNFSFQGIERRECTQWREIFYIC